MRAASTLAACAALALVVGCGSSEEETPATCLGGARPFLAALQQAPAKVQLHGDVAISSCLIDNQAAGDLAGLGSALVEATTTLNAQALRTPPEATRLGYLVGAVRKGAEGTSGIHADLVRRIEAAAELSPGGGPLPNGFEAAYGRGLQAGRAGG